MSKWEWKKLGEVCEIICGQDYKDVECESGAYPVYGSGGVIGYAREFRCPANCTIVGRKGSINNPMYVEEPFWNIDTAFGLSAKECMESKYLFYFCKCFDFTTLDKSSGRPSLARKDLLEIQIPIPPLSEQERIVKFLDEEFSKIETLKTNAETNLKNAKALYQKSLDKIIEDECRRYTLTSLKEITTKIGSGATPKGGKKSYQTEGISLIRSMNVLYGSFSYDNLAHINEKQAKALDGVAIQCADVLFNITGASIARCCVVPDDVIPARVNQHVSILRPIQKVLNSDYLSVVLLASQNQKKLLDIGEAGATRQALTKGDLEVFPIPLPPLSVQKEIVARLDKLSENVKRLEANYKQIIADCDELKKSILKKTFEGDSRSSRE